MADYRKSFNKSRWQLLRCSAIILIEVNILLALNKRFSGYCMLGKRFLCQLKVKLILLFHLPIDPIFYVKEKAKLNPPRISKDILGTDFDETWLRTPTAIFYLFSLFLK